MSKQNLALLINDLQAPLIVSEILKNEDSLKESDYALSSLVSDMRMDQALLAIALSAHTIVEPYIHASPTLKVVYTHSKRIIEDATYDYLNAPLFEDVSDQEQLTDSFDNIAEDLEHVAELLDLAMNFFQSKDMVAYDLCKLLQAQAQSHHLIAETFASKSQSEGGKVSGGGNLLSKMTSGQTAGSEKSFVQASKTENNILQFPF